MPKLRATFRTTFPDELQRWLMYEIFSESDRRKEDEEKIQIELTPGVFSWSAIAKDKDETYWQITWNGNTIVVQATCDVIVFGYLTIDMGHKTITIKSNH